MEVVHKADKIFLGMGEIWQDQEERETGRFGTVFLQSGVGVENPLLVETVHLFVHCVGRLICIPQDWKRDKFIPLPEVFLGEGKLFYEYRDGIDAVGISPTDGRKTDWLDAKAIESLEHIIVELYFIPKQQD